MIDITLPMRHGMAVYPEDPAVELAPVCEISGGDGVNLKRYSFGSHTGTHVDAPYHFFADGKKADNLPADFFIGRARVIALMSGRDIAREDIEAQGIQPDDMVLFKTPNGVHLFDVGYYHAHVSVLASAAHWLVQKGVRAVGIDYLSIEKDTNYPVHRLLLGAGIPIIEGLCLTDAEPGVYRMTAMMMRIENSDGAPLRAVLERI